MTGKIVYKRAKNGQYYFVLKAKNGFALVSSSLYEEKRKMVDAAVSMLKAAVAPKLVDETD